MLPSAADSPSLLPRYPEGSGVHEQAEIITAALAKSALLAKIKREVKDEIIKPKYTAGSLAKELPQLMEQMGATVRIANHIHQLHAAALRDMGTAAGPTGAAQRRAGAPRVAVPGAAVHAPPLPPLPRCEDPSDTVTGIRRRWRQFLLDRLHRIAREYDIPIARLRTAQTESLRRLRDVTTADRRRRIRRVSLSLSQLNQFESDEGAPGDPGSDVEHGGTQGGAEQAAFTAADLLEHFAGVVSSNHSQSVTKLAGWGLVALELPVPSVDTLCARFADLDPRHRQLGADEGLRDWFNDERIRVGGLLLARGSVPDLRAYSRRGVPTSLRRDVWRRLLGVPSEGPQREKEAAHLEVLRQDVSKVEMLVDDLVRWDIKCCSNDDKYFVFDEQLERILVPLMRDRQCLRAADTAVPRLIAQARESAKVAYPPGGTVPFDGLATLCAPLCFLYPDLTDVYCCFRAFLCRHWIKLQAISSQPDTAISLARLFERLVQTTNPDVVYHCLSIGVPPLRVAWPWIFTAFAGFLEVHEIFHLWDRVLAYDSLEPIAILAAAIFLWRSRGLMQCEVEADVQRLFTDFTKIQVVPLLQHFLFT